MVSHLAPNTNIWAMKKVTFKYSSSSLPPAPSTSPRLHTHVRTRTHACSYTQTCRPLLEVSTQTIILTADLAGIKSIRLSSVLSQLSSLHGTARSRISKACPKVTGWLLGALWGLPATCLRTAGVLQWKSIVSSLGAPPTNAFLAYKISRSSSSWKMEPTQDRISGQKERYLGATGEVWVKDGCWWIVIHECWFIHCDKCIVLVVG